MNNLQIEDTSDYLFIRKGVLKLEYLSSYFFLFLFCLLLSLVSGNVELLEENIFIKFVVLIHYFGFGMLLLIGPRIFLEKIKIASNKIYIESINYQMEKEIYSIDKIEVTSLYGASYTLWNRGTFFARFYDKCSLVLKFKDGNEYKWGYKMSYNKGLEVKYLLESKINDIKKELRVSEKEGLQSKEFEKWKCIYEHDIELRYFLILEKIWQEKTLLFSEGEMFVVNDFSLGIESLEQFKEMNLQKVEFHEFYLNYLSLPSLANRIVEVGYNGVDSKKVTMKELKEDINRLRDSN